MTTTTTETPSGKSPPIHNSNSRPRRMRESFDVKISLMLIISPEAPAAAPSGKDL